ncbi:N-acetylmuramoyl-L-alanine amidase [Sphingomonas sp. CJ99]
MGFIIAFFAAFLAGPSAWAGTVEAVRIDDDRITIRFDGTVAAASAFLLDGPRRIAVDVDGARPGGDAVAAGPVLQVRQGWRDGAGARIVFDLDRPALLSGGRFDAARRTLVLNLAPADDAAFARAAAGGRLTIAGSAPRATAAVPAARAAPPLPEILGDDAARPLVVIDAGHGGRDPGTISPFDRTNEKDMTLRLARAIRDRLLATGKVRVALTRDDDRYLLLQDRYGIARRLGADLFISVHCDSAPHAEASGATAYTLSEIASDKEAARLAARENKADIIAGIDLGGAESDVRSILIDLTQRETMNLSANFARLLGREAQDLIPVKPNFHRMASLVVLKAPDMPSILLEAGYLTNEKDARFLASADGRRRLAESVARAVEVHFARRLVSREAIPAG